MIDKIELRLPPWTDFHPSITAQLRQFGTARPTRLYSGVLDLRPHGFDAMLHYRNRMGDHSHKLELFETGKKSYSELIALVESAIAGDSSRLDLMRIDLCADVPDIPVSWFHQHARFRYKQMGRRLGALTCDTICRVDIETITTGARPNVYRIYNKVAERLARFKQARKKQSREADDLEFEKEYGCKPTDTLTRIERQYGGGRLPETVRRFGNIAKTADLDPFDSMELECSFLPIPSIELCGLSEYAMGMGYRREAITRGMHGFRRWLNKYSNGNAARIIKRYAAFMPQTGCKAIDKSHILNLYRESTVRQLAG